MRRKRLETKCGLVLGRTGTTGFLLCFLTGVLLLAGCSGSKVTTQASSDMSRYQVGTIALVPFSALATPQVRDSGDHRLSAPESIRRSDISLPVPPHAVEQLGQTVTVPDYAAEKVTQLFWNRLRNRKGVVVLSPYDIAKLGDLGPAATPEAMGAEVAKKVKADVAMIGRVLVYQERVGSRAGASPPAAVGFQVKVVALDGRVLWVGNYYERQQPMTEDLFGFLRRWAFVTAEELARYGVDEVMKEFPFGIEEE
ncbi:hypothetical protein [Petrachloros mirabilis]